MKKVFHSFCLIAGAVLFSAAAHASVFSSVDMDSTGVQEAQKKKSGFIIKRAIDDIKVDGKEKSLKGKTKIIIPFFRLNFVTDDKYRNSVGGATSTSTSKVKSSLEGVEPEVMQRVTDEMYADLIAQLQRAGYEVVSNDLLNGSEKYQKLDDEYPEVKKDVVKVTPSGLTFPGRFRDPAPDISEDLDALVLKADFDVDFLVINRNESRFNLLKDKSHVDVTQGVNAVGVITVYAEDKMTTITVQQPVTSQRPFGVLSDETSALSKVNDVAVFASGWVTGQGLGSKRQTSRDFDVIADNNQYRLAVGDVFVQINRKVADILKELRDA